MSDPSGRTRRPTREEAARALDLVARDLEETLADAAALGDGAPTGAVEVLRDLPLPRRAAGPGPALVRLLPVAAAIAVLVWLVDLRAPGEPPGPGGVHLDPGGFALLPPDPAARAWRRLEWTFPSPTVRWFEVRVVDPTAAAGATLLRERVRGTRLDLDPERTTAWPKTLIVEIDALDDGGALVDSLQSVSSLSSP